MPSTERKLYVFAHLSGGWAPAGQLTLTEDGSQLQASAYAYGLNYLERPDCLEVDPVDLGLADKALVTGKLLLPGHGLAYFGGIRDAAPDAWGRRVIEAKLQVPANSLAESEYLLHAGSERVGALDVRASLDAPPTAPVGSLHQLSHLLEAADRIEEGLPIPAHLEGIFQVGTALGGARPKASVRDETGLLWLAKFSRSQDPFDIPGVECATLRLAKAAGLTVPAVRCVTLGNRKVMLIRRFDRFWANAADAGAPEGPLHETQPAAGLTERRMGFVSGLTMVGCDEADFMTKSYADLAAAMRAYCHPSVLKADGEELFMRMVFNILVTNTDDHLRNHGFVHDTRIGGWRLSPLYDVLPSPSVAFERMLLLGVGAQGRLANLDNAMSEHAKFHLTQTRAAQRIDQVWRTVREWQVHFEQAGVDAQDIGRVTSAFRHLDEVSSPQLRKLLA